MKTLNWHKKSLRWFDVEYNGIAIILMSRISEELTMEEVEHWYKDGFILEKKEENSYTRLNLEDLKRMAI